ncbi:hypothetical protein Y032_0025g1226 [Ancylostoma ceylanicum]|uniref:Uncharacterized protein n=1 Tax=Ancylostoma ceylanicum TaxID=53326 RepID=A0A016UUT0_9BILA|nr:hypothetical protein Y032_0025g1226 [Ancylostoma ceylanicum]
MDGSTMPPFVRKAIEYDSPMEEGSPAASSVKTTEYGSDDGGWVRLGAVAGDNAETLAEIQNCEISGVSLQKYLHPLEQSELKLYPAAQ